ncbi:transferrin isoform X1 [Maniola jurtina]|uniref:transferrin isoform X1 n=2 Tax=Maniola jurtina TaxID=191418 RepID=UPI001E68C1E7|nr:transferrin isoform X1 [Maniola jurtina]
MVARMTMTLKYILVLIALTGANVNCKSTYKICVPSEYMTACEEMLQVDTKSKAALECIPARDRVECLTFVQQRQADLVPVDPEDMYVASKIPNQDFVVFQEYRTDEEPDAEFRYEAVIVIHKDLPINNLDQLKGLKSCHTGVNRNVGYKIPLTMLMKRSVFPKMTDRTISPKENELRALSTFFKKSCIVGTWSPDPKTTSAWKAQYSQLCALCEHPDICDYPDNYSGYDGALRCLAHNGGEVAFTKVIYTRKFFGLPVGTTPASQSPENPDEYAYLCVDGSKVPVRQKACSWAARPWQGLLGHNDVLAKLSPLREKIKQLANAGAELKPLPEWFTKVLGLSERIHYVADNIPIKPADYLSKANYTEVIERGHGPPEPVVRLCVTSNVELAKCRAMSVFAFSRDIRPKLDCVQESSEAACLKVVQDNGADLAAVDGLRVASASKQYNLHPVFHEVYGSTKTPNYAVAVVKKNTPFNNVEDLRGKRSCHSSYSNFGGFAAPLYYLINKQKISSDQCVKNFGDFFSGSCVPGVDKPENNPRGDDVSKLKKQCSSDNKPWVCLQEDRADVAFVLSADLSNFDASQYELLCLNRESGGRDSLANFETCNIALAPTRTWLSAKDFLSDVSIAHTPLSLAELLNDKTDLFNIYGEFFKNNNVIFNNNAKGLATTEKIDFEKFKNIHDVLNACGVV